VALGLVLLGALAGCARPTPPLAPVSAAPPARAMAEAENANAPAGDDPGETALDAVRAALAAAGPDEGMDEGLFSREAIHLARIELAKEALVEDNAQKQRVDVQEQLQRELDALTADEHPAKSRRRQQGAHR
jgi:hypothetical protein